MMTTARILVCCFGLVQLAAAAGAAIKTTPGEFVIDPPTLINLGFEWLIEGDDNRNATVEVAYRRAGEVEWRQGLPLLRLQGERIYQSEGVFDVISPNMFAGSILDLEPDTAYEARFTMSDPDGLAGQSGKVLVKTVTVRTRAEPKPYAGGRVFHVYPPTYSGPKIEPAFDALMCAYNYYCGGGDTVTAGRPRVKAGDVILVHAGTYKYHRDLYTGDRTINATTPVEGTYYLTASGTPDKPIVIKGAGDGDVIFDGDGNFNLFNLMAANYNYFEGITIRNTNVAFLLGIKNIAGANGFTLKHSRLENIGRGVVDEWSGSKNYYIGDNVFIGRHDPNKLQSWYTPAVWSKFPGYPAPITSEYAVKVYGQGHVVAFNYAANWHDGIDIATYGNPDGTPNEIADRVPLAIDFYNSDFSNMADN